MTRRAVAAHPGGSDARHRYRAAQPDHDRQGDHDQAVQRSETPGHAFRRRPRARREVTAGLPGHGGLITRADRTRTRISSTPVRRAATGVRARLPTTTSMSPRPSPQTCSVRTQWPRRRRPVPCHADRMLMLARSWRDQALYRDETCSTHGPCSPPRLSELQSPSLRQWLPGCHTGHGIGPGIRLPLGSGQLKGRHVIR